MPVPVATLSRQRRSSERGLHDLVSFEVEAVEEALGASDDLTIGLTGGLVSKADIKTTYRELRCWHRWRWRVSGSRLPQVNETVIANIANAKLASPGR